MFKSRDNLSPSCSSSEELVAYLYGEMGSAGQSTFEAHLSACDVCTTEFAELSLARLDVYEWHRDEFVELATPRIVVPYEQAAKASWTDAVRAFFTVPAFATAGGAFAVVAIVAGVWLMSQKQTDIAIVEVPASSPITVANKRDEVKQAKQAEIGDNTAGPKTSENQKATVEEPQSVKATTSRNPKAISTRSVKAEKNSPQPVRTRRPTAPPRLNDFQDEDDDTLRLGDLLAEVDTRH